VAHLHDDLGAATVALNPATMAQLDGMIHSNKVTGSRYNAQGNSEVDTEAF
jgi:hypothetical protein